MALWSVDNEPRFHAFMAEVDRLVHNFLASAASLIYYDRRIMRSAYEHSPIWGRYMEAVAERFDGGQALFVQGLRNYTAHYDLPGSFGQLSMGPESYRSLVMLDRDRLLEWDGWKRGARDFLENQGKEVDLAGSIKFYASAVDSLHEWMTTTHQVEHAEDLARFQERVREHDRIAMALRASFELP